MLRFAGNFSFATLKGKKKTELEIPTKIRIYFTMFNIAEEMYAKNKKEY
jgi:hypothetical protein